MDTPNMTEEQFREWLAKYAGEFGIPKDQLLGMLDEISFDDIHDRIQRKDGIRRLLVWLQALDDLLSKGPALIESGSEDHHQACLKLVEHIKETWQGAVCLHENGAYALSGAIAITAIEETGKLAVERYRLAGIPGFDLSLFPPRTELGISGEASFYNHADKHLVAGLGGALINNRLDRIFGVDYINWFLDAAEKGRLEKLRRRYLYSDVANKRLQLPNDLVDQHESLRLVCLAGEVIAEVMVFNLEESDRVLSAVHELEISGGLANG